MSSLLKNTNKFVGIKKKRIILIFPCLLLMNCEPLKLLAKMTLTKLGSRQVLCCYWWNTVGKIKTKRVEQCCLV